MLLEPGECECVTLLGQIISEIDPGSEKKKSSGGNEKENAVSTGIGFLHSCWNEEQSALFHQLPAVLGCLLCWHASLAGVPGCLPCWGTPHSSYKTWGSL